MPTLQAVDKDRSGEISIEEFKIFFTCLGLTHDVNISYHYHMYIYLRRLFVEFLLQFN